MTKVPIMIRSHWRLLTIILTPILLLPLPLISSTSASKCAFVVLLMSVYWMFELIPLPITAFIPVILFPILNIMGTSDTSLYYMKSTVMLYVSGLIVAVAVENSNLHRRIALKTILLFGTSPRRLMFGFMLPTALLSMWISNTATTAMMVPIIEALLDDLEHSSDKNNKKYVENRRNMMMLAVAYAANIGGTGTLIGTSPNLILFEYISELDGQPINFGSWIAFCFPELILNLILCWIWLQIMFVGFPKFHWFFRSPGFIPGWADNLSSTFCPSDDTSKCKIDAATPAFLICLFLFVIPAKPGTSQPALITWSIVETRLPWGVVILMGGGFAMAEGCNRSGLNSWIGSQLVHLQDLNQTLLLLLICFLISVVTQVASNGATASMLLPVLLKLSQALKLNPLYLMLPACLTCSYAFMLPVSTAPNAIVFEASGMKILDMVKAGVVMNIITILTTVGCISSYGVSMFDLDLFPTWANLTTDYHQQF